MAVTRFDALWTGDSWLETAFVETDSSGRILAVRAEADEVDEVVSGFALPGFMNAHSHAFQYAMAGVAEHAVSQGDDFWSWRETMYALALSVSPEDVEAIAAMLYAEMLRHGFTAVTEFHYLHHDPDGKPYADQAEMSRRLIQAAQRTGIHLTITPVFYRTGDFGKAALPEQRRFLSKSVDAYLDLVASVEQAARGLDRCRVGAGMHSLRAGDPEEVRAVFANAPVDAPLHIHIAEQQKEVMRCQEHLGQRPVEWLLDCNAVDARYHLVHATHMTDEETRGVADSGATVVICPSTEGNLGDGFFPLQTYRRCGGSWSIGTDSHVGLSPMEELRWLDYGQRLGMEKRNILCARAGDDSGVLAYTESLAGGRRSMGLTGHTGLEVGQPLDVVVFDANDPILATTSSERRLATIIYSRGESAIRSVYVQGRKMVERGVHVRSAEIREQFVKRVRQLGLR